jgi:hypothetical protein
MRRGNYCENMRVVFTADNISRFLETFSQRYSLNFDSCFVRTRLFAVFSTCEVLIKAAIIFNGLVACAQYCGKRHRNIDVVVYTLRCCSVVNVSSRVSKSS